MAMEVEYVDMGAEDIGEVAEMAAADIVNGAGEVVVERDEPEEISQGEDGITLVVGEDVELVESEWVEHSPESQTATADSPPLDDETLGWSDWAMSDARFKAEFDHKQEIAEAKEAHTAASLARQAAEEVFKAAKATEKACLSELSSLINRGPDYPKPANPASINQEGGSGDSQSAIATAVRNDKDSRPIPIDDPNADQSWRAIPTSEILDGIKGMGDKKRDAIISLIPTMGDLEDLRGQASIAHKPFRSVLPKGVGQGMADEIEERALSRMRKHQLSLEAAKTSQPVVEVVEEVNQGEDVKVEIEVEAEVEYEDEPEATTLVDVEDV